MPSYAELTAEQKTALQQKLALTAVLQRRTNLTQKTIDKVVGAVCAEDSPIRIVPKGSPQFRALEMFQSAQQAAKLAEEASDPFAREKLTKVAQERYKQALDLHEALPGDV